MRHRTIAGSHDLAGPAIVRMPALTPHIVINAGTVRVSRTCAFPHTEFREGYVALGPNPLPASNMDGATRET